MAAISVSTRVTGAPHVTSGPGSASPGRVSYVPPATTSPTAAAETATAMSPSATLTNRGAVSVVASGRARVVVAMFAPIAAIARA